MHRNIPGFLGGLTTSQVKLIPFALLFIGCAAGNNAATLSRQAGEKVPPGHCRVIAEVVRIDSTFLENSGNGPCSKAPCTAWILVRSVIAHGSGTDQIGPGDTLQTRFAFTLAPTSKKEFPGLNTQLPGLSVGSVFTADIQAMPPHLHTAHRGEVYMVYGYRKLES